MKRVMVCLLLVALWKQAQAKDGEVVAGLDSLARATLNAGLQIQGIGEKELGFYKQWAIDSFFRLKVVDQLLDHPLETPGYTEQAAAKVCSLEERPVALLEEMWNEIDVRFTSRDSARLVQEVMAEAKRPGLEGTGALPPSLSKAIGLVLAGFRVGDRYLKRAIANIPKDELDRLLGEAPDFWRDSDDTLEKSLAGVLHREFGLSYDTSQEVKSETLLAYSRKIDRRSIALSGLAVMIGVLEAKRVLEAWPPQFGHEAQLKTVEQVTGGVHFFTETEWGDVIVGSGEENIYKRDASLLIELGGNDQYQNRAAGAIGILSHPFSVVIDLGGDDTYFADRLFSQGAALFGAGVLIDCAGDDVYRSNHYCQGAAIFGTGLLWDCSGRDIYEAGFYGQGAGHYGVGLLLDNEGNDSYRSFCYCQGFASTWGYGLLAEMAGNDIYYAGGRYLHEPLLPREYRSFSQGFAIGQRPDAAGGIGFLCDRSGNDFYDSEVFAQGTSYWYSLGMLWDGSGFDHYSAQQYSQGAGIHLSVGVLIDEEGNDSYFSRLGPSQGEGHDLSVGVLIDRKGDDGYYASGGQGIGLTNSVGLFLDCDGNDWFMASESLICQGSSNWARGFGGIGIFLDLAGRDQYPARNIAQDQSRWTKGTYGSGIDLPRPATVIDWEPDVDTTEVEVDTITQPVDSVFRTASIWQVGNAVKKVKRARKQLIALGRKAIEYVFEKKADTKDGLESQAIEALFKAWPDTAKPYLFRLLRDNRWQARQNGAYWLGELKENGRDGVDSILLALREKRITPRRGAYALGQIGDSLVVPQILYLLRDTLEVSRIVTAEACGKLKNPVAIPHLIRTLGDRFFTVRSAAEAGLVAMGRPALESLLANLPRLKVPALGHAIRACGALAAKLDSAEQGQWLPKCREAILPYIKHNEPFVRLVSVQALGEILDEPTAQALKQAQAEEKNEFVLTAYRQTLGTR
ncbi:MAG: hypothetical protein ABIK44_02975 [candidate division WOR-3 bacterium]